MKFMILIISSISKNFLSLKAPSPFQTANMANSQYTVWFQTFMSHLPLRNAQALTFRLLSTVSFQPMYLFWKKKNRYNSNTNNHRLFSRLCQKHLGHHIILKLSLKTTKIHWRSVSYGKNNTIALSKLKLINKVLQKLNLTNVDPISTVLPPQSIF